MTCTFRPDRDFATLRTAILTFRNPGVLCHASRPMRTHTTIAVLLALAASLLSAPPASAATYEQRYDDALALYNSGQISSSIRQFRALTDESRSHSLSDNAQYWIGEAFFRLRQYEQAIVEFDRTLTYPRTNKCEDAIYKLAACHEKLGKIEMARELYTRLLAEFPNTRHASYVMEKIDLLGP